MDLLFLALESPLFPGAVLAFFFALAARALTQGPEIALADVPRSFRVEVPEPRPVEEAASEATIRMPAGAIEAVSTASYSSSCASADEDPAICSESDSESLASDMPIQWL